MTIFQNKFIEKLNKFGISNPKKFLEENACDGEGLLHLDMANLAIEKIISAPAKINLDVEGFKQQMKNVQSQEGASQEKLITPDLLPREIMYNIPDLQIPEESSQDGSEKFGQQI